MFSTFFFLYMKKAGLSPNKQECTNVRKALVTFQKIKAKRGIIEWLPWIRAYHMAGTVSVFEKMASL